MPWKLGDTTEEDQQTQVFLVPLSACRDSNKASLRHTRGLSLDKQEIFPPIKEKVFTSLSVIGYVEALSAFRRVRLLDSYPQL